MNFKRGGMLRFFSVGVIDQAILSAANFAVGLLMLRRTDDMDYGLFVLATSSFLLLIGAQGATVSGPMSVLAPKKSDAEKLAMVSTLMRALMVFWLPVSVLGVVAFWLAPRMGLDQASAYVGLAAAVGAVGVLLREAIRVLWMLYGRPRLLLGFDLLFVVLYLALALWTTAAYQPAAPFIVLGLGIASGFAALFSWLHFKRRVGWVAEPYPRAVPEVWRLGKWALSGCVVTWLHNQGFYYVVTAMRGVDAVSGLAASRLLLMPVNLMITGVGQLLLPMASSWLSESGTRKLIRNLGILAAVVTAGAVAYFLVLWVFREWIFEVVLKRDFSDADLLLLLWGAVFFLTCLRSFAQVALQAMERFDKITYLSLASTGVSLSVGYLGILWIGAPGSLIGLICGEIVDIAGLILLTARQVGLHNADLKASVGRQT